MTLVVLYWGGKYSVHQLAAQQSNTLSQHWHRLLSHQSARTNEERIEQLGALAFYPRIKFLQMRLEHNLSQLANYSHGTHNYSARVHQAINRLERKQQRHPEFQSIDMVDENIVLSSSRIELPQQVNGKPAYGIIIIGFDSSELHQTISQHVLGVFLYVVLALLLLVGFLTLRQRLLFIDPLKQLLTEPAWCSNRGTVRQLPSQYTSSLLTALTRLINAEFEALQRSTQRLQQRQQRLAEEHQQRQLSHQLQPSYNWQIDINNGDFSIDRTVLANIGLVDMPTHLHVHDLLARIHPEDLTQIKSQFDRLQRNHRAMEFVARVINNTNEMRHIKCSASFSCDDMRSQTLVGCSIDVTESVRQQQSLRLEQIKASNAEHRLDALSKLTEVAIIQVDHAGTIRSLNLTGHQLLGYPDQQLLNRHISELTELENSDPKTQFNDPFRPFSVNNQRDSNVRLRKADNSTVLVNLTLTEQQLGGNYCLTGIFKPISTAIEPVTASDGLVDIHPVKKMRFAMMDSEQRIVAISPALAKTLGYRSQDLINTNLIDLVPANFRQATKQQCLTGECINAKTAALSHRNGEIIWLRITIMPLQNMQSEQPLLLIQVARVLERITSISEKRQGVQTTKHGSFSARADRA
ncbi:PAS domain S-box protein [Ferrimonas lipolytica]|uniref:histidine kinase n=1 Tax=Ferrimonas lipolytica TaxID=2724191 RepID=A0A6H1UD48_9GAMM|nr:PAS domain S-box protein [Ferrimonas lipolytica]QIZ76768.1 PAS domain S-box protein [Ferrimonas lipolytica]